MPACPCPQGTLRREPPKKIGNSEGHQALAAQEIIRGSPSCTSRLLRRHSSLWNLVAHGTAGTGKTPKECIIRGVDTPGSCRSNPMRAGSCLGERCGVRMSLWALGCRSGRQVLASSTQWMMTLVAAAQGLTIQAPRPGCAPHTGASRSRPLSADRVQAHKLSHDTCSSYAAMLTIRPRLNAQIPASDAAMHMSS